MNIPPWTPIERPCIQCKKPFLAEKAASTICSDACRKERSKEQSKKCAQRKAERRRLKIVAEKAARPTAPALEPPPGSVGLAAASIVNGNIVLASTWIDLGNLAIRFHANKDALAADANAFEVLKVAHVAMGFKVVKGRDAS